MVAITFYEKPGCGTNARQKRLLEAAGHVVFARNLLTTPWSGKELLAFFGDAPVAAWFNPAAPRVKTGEINPETIDASTALGLMLADPLLIRRPLVDAEGRKCAGFDREPVLSLLGAAKSDEIVEGCSRPAGAAPCSEPAPAAQAQNPGEQP